VLRITDHAISFLDDIRSAQRIPEHFGIRVSAPGPLNGQTPVQIDFREMPVEGDEVKERAGARLFVSPDINGADVVLDVDTTGAGKRLILRGV